MMSPKEETSVPDLASDLKEKNPRKAEMVAQNQAIFFQCFMLHRVGFYIRTKVGLLYSPLQLPNNALGIKAASCHNLVL